MSNEELDLLEKYEARTLSHAEQLRFDQKMNENVSFREQVESHRSLLNSLKTYDDRKSLNQTLNEIHAAGVETMALKKSSFSIRQLWPTIAIAASVALVIATGTLFMARWFDLEHQTNYQELRKNVEKLKKSQTQILENIKANNKKDFAPGKYSGSGFLISSNGYVVTSYHVVKAADSVYIENDKYGKLKATVVYAEPSSDIALLMIVDDEFQKTKKLACSIRGREADIGEAVYTLGFPREEIVYGEGSISASSGYEQNENAYQVSVPVNPGNSGGPLIDQQGALIGIVNGVQTQTQGAAFAIKSDVLLETLQHFPADSLQRPLKLSSQNPLAGMTRVNQIKRWKDFVFIVRVYH
jgi:S1-C subfamily serine protease